MDLYGRHKIDDIDNNNILTTSVRFINESGRFFQSILYYFDITLLRNFLLFVLVLLLTLYLVIFFASMVTI